MTIHQYRKPAPPYKRTYDPVVPYYPGPREDIWYANVALPDHSSVYPLFWTNSMISTWRARANGAVSNVNSANAAVRAIANQWIVAANITTDIVKNNMYRVTTTVANDAVYWYNSDQPNLYEVYYTNAALVWKTGYDEFGANVVSNTTLQTERFDVIQDWLLKMVNHDLLDMRPEGFRTPNEVGSGKNDTSAIEVASVGRVTSWIFVIFVYDLLRESISAANRTIIENRIRMMCEYLRSTVLDYGGLAGAFYNNMYLKVGNTHHLISTNNAGAPLGNPVSFDTSEGPNTYNYCTTTGYGPRTLTGALSWNNRVAYTATVLALGGAILRDSSYWSLAVHWVRTMLAYGTSDDGSNHEWGNRGWDYDIPQQGRIYYAVQLQAVCLIGAVLKRALGSNAVFSINTSAGHQGTWGTNKTVAKILDTYINLYTRTGTQYDWYALPKTGYDYSTAVKYNSTTAGNTWPVTHMGGQEVSYNAGAWPHTIQNNNGWWADTAHDIAVLFAYEHYHSVGDVAAAGSTKTARVLANCIVALARRDSLKWQQATGVAPNTMPGFPGDNVIAGEKTRAEPYGLYDTHINWLTWLGDVIPAPHFMYLPASDV